MRIYSIERGTFCPPESPLTPFHRCMYHGLARRPGGETPNDPDGCPPFGKNRERLHLTINVANGISTLSLPKGRLVVRQDVLDDIEPLLKGLEVRPAVVEKAIDFPFKKGDKSFSINRERPIASVQRPFYSQPDVRDPTDIPSIFEVLVPFLLDIADQFPEAVPTVFTYDDKYEKPFEVSLSRHMFDERSIIWDEGRYLVHENVGSKLTRHIDTDYILIGHAELA